VKGRILASLLLLAVLGSRAARAQAGDSMDIPVGKGTLRQDAITLRLTSASLEIRIVPLDERVTRLLAPDGYQALKALQATKQRGVDSIAAGRGITRPGLALVSFHALAPGTRFDPSLLTVGLHGQQIRAIGVIPMSAAFSNQQLDVRDLATGLFVFERPLPVTDAFTVSYLSATTEDWNRRLEQLDAERARILSRGRARTDSGGH
jgi:hypothetical protein